MLCTLPSTSPHTQIHNTLINSSSIQYKRRERVFVLRERKKQMERGFSNTLPSSSSGLSNPGDANASNSNNNNNSANSNTNTNNNDNANRQEQQPTRDHEQVMSVANLKKLMRRVLPPNAKVSDEARDTMQECVAEFINYVTGEANIHCHREKRKTINAEDLLWAMGQLGFESYVGPLTLYLNRYREAETGRPYSRGGSAPYVNRTVDYTPPQWVPNYGPNFNLGPQSQMIHGATMGGVFGDPVRSLMDGSVGGLMGGTMGGSMGWRPLNALMGGGDVGSMGWRPLNEPMSGVAVGSMGGAPSGAVGGEMGGPVDWSLNGPIGGVTSGSMGGGATGWLAGGATAWLTGEGSYYGNEAGASSSSSPPPLPDFDPYDDLE